MPDAPAATLDRRESKESQRLQQLSTAIVARELARARRRRFSQIGLPILALLTFVILWEIGVRIFEIPQWLIPSPLAIYDAFVDNHALMWPNLWVTSQETLLGFALAAVIAVPIGILINVSRTFSDIVYPFLISSNAIPKVAIAPLFVVWFGFGLLPKILIAFLTAFFPIIINTVVGMRSVDDNTKHLARSMGFGVWRSLWRIELPQSMPAIFAGFKLASVLAVIGAVVGEFVGADSGLGQMLLLADAGMQTPLMFATLIVLTLMSVVFFYLIVVIEAIAVPWHKSDLQG